MQGAIIFEQSAGGDYPLPSSIDKGDNTIALKPGEAPETKDTSANIFSILIFNGYIPAEMCISMLERNPNIQVMSGYAYTAPPTAANPAKALWDPAFKADFTGGKIGNLSFAHHYPDLVKRPSWERAWDRKGFSSRAMIGDRGPQVTSVDTSIEPPKAQTPPGRQKASSWRGDVGFADNHVDALESSIFAGTYKDKAGKARPDCLFFDEPDADSSGNSYLGIFIKAGPSRRDCVGIWD